MDFLDPRYRKTYQLRLMIGYFLISIAIILTTVALVEWASGFRYNTETGSISENGLLFVDSQPSGANIYLNEQKQKTKTSGSSRFDLAAGDYNLSIQKDGYLDWTRKVSIAGNDVDRIDYPFLFPASITTQSLNNFSAVPELVSQTPDQRWLLIETGADSNGSVNFLEYDTQKPKQAPVSLSLPSTTMTNPTTKSKLTGIEWSANSAQLLLKREYSQQTEFIIFDRTDNLSSYNVSKVFNFSGSRAGLVGQKSDNIYLLDVDKNLYQGDVSKKQTKLISKNVVDFKALPSSQVAYFAQDVADTSKYLTSIYDGGKNYSLNSFSTKYTPVLNFSVYDSHLFLAVTSDSEARINVYEDPLSALKNSSPKVSPIISLVNSGNQTLTVSENGRFFASQADKNFTVFDIEKSSRVRFSLDFSPPESFSWMDGYRLIGKHDNKLFVTDFDGINHHDLTPLAGSSAYFDKNYYYLFNFSQNDSAVSFSVSDLRAGVDLPK